MDKKPALFRTGLLPMFFSDLEAKKWWVINSAATGSKLGVNGQIGV